MNSNNFFLYYLAMEELRFRKLLPAKANSLPNKLDKVLVFAFQ